MEEDQLAVTLSIDIIIPCARPSGISIQSLITMKIPAGVLVRFILVIDSREAVLPGSFERLKNCGSPVTIFLNPANIGAAATRNVGLELSRADYVLFLDDDVVPDEDLLIHYARAIHSNSKAWGFVGVTEFPSPVNRFTAGVIESDILTFFGIAQTRARLSWGTTSNMLLKRSSLDGIRFSDEFPKQGGGEDIDFCLRSMKKHSVSMVAVPDALVIHDWWNSGKRSYRRFFRWAFGDSALPSLHEEFKYRNFPNLMETWLILVPLLLLLSNVNMVSHSGAVLFLLLSFAANFVSELVRINMIRPTCSLSIAFESSLIRLFNDAGRLVGNIRRGRLSFIGERFDYFTTGESVMFERKMSATSFVFFCIVAIFSVAVTKII